MGQNCLGRPASDVQVRIVGENGKEVAVGCPGELLVRHAGADAKHGFFTEYYKDPQGTCAAWEGGWFHTGDIVRKDADGDMFFVDRKKNVIRRSGENIMAVEVESTLMRHPSVITAGVAAVNDGVRGEEVFACLVVEGGAEADRLRDIVKWCLTQIAYYKVPGFVASVSQLPLTATQKSLFVQKNSQSLQMHSQSTKMHSQSTQMHAQSTQMHPQSTQMHSPSTQMHSPR